jgi:putative hydrolase of the HAD superfamily
MQIGISVHNTLVPGKYTTVFLDAGNTLLSMDFKRVAEELGKLGLFCDPETLMRAEAASRPAISAHLTGAEKRETQKTFETYIGFILKQLPAALVSQEERIDHITEKLAALIHTSGRADLLWNEVMPGTVEALRNFQEKNLRLAVVSNADGTVEKSLRELGLRDFFSAVIDSHVVGFEKPDPRIFQQALRASGASPGSTLHVGDLYHADIIGARSAGLDAVLLDPYDDWKDVDCLRFPDLLALSAVI